MKVVTPKQMSTAELQAFRAGASESAFMEEAGSGVALAAYDFAEQEELDRHVILLCGKGNNAGDAYVAGIQLLHLDYEVTAYQLFPISECSPLCSQNYFQFANDGGKVIEINNIAQVIFPPSGIIIDGIFGTGFRGTVDEPVSSIIQAANQSKLPIISVDIPSGLNGTTGEVEGEAIVATITAFLGLPKTGFFLEKGWDHVGKLVHIDFGLEKEFIDNSEYYFEMISPDMVKPLMPKIIRSRHKYQAGHVIGLAGSPAMPGAAMLASFAALSSGAGIVHLLYPEGMDLQLTHSPYELLKVPYKYSEVDKVLEMINTADAVFIGPGLELTDQTKNFLKKILPKIETPSVIDATALNILSQEKIPLPEQTILTPHLGEYKRLIKLEDVTIDMRFLNECQAFARDWNVTLILKGGPTYVFHPNTPLAVCPRGDPGMATAGSGDVLTGLLASLLAQGLTSYQAATLGTYIHGIAGEKAAQNLTSYVMTASDIIDFFPDAFRPNHWI